MTRESLICALATAFLCSIIGQVDSKRFGNNDKNKR
jgi:hypothetical protein